MIGSWWQDDLDDIITDVIFPDETLRKLMKLPADIDLYHFITKYFIRAGTSTEILTNESVRIVYGISYSTPTNNPMVLQNEMSFEIYVKAEDLRNVTGNIMKTRTTLIARHLYNLLTKSKYNGVYHFFPAGQKDSHTSVPGYVRYTLSVGYLQTC